MKIFCLCEIFFILLLKNYKRMGDKEHYDDFDVLAKMLEKRDQESPNESKDEEVKSEVKANDDIVLNPGKETKKKRPAASREPGNFDNVLQFSIHLSRREHILLKTMSFISGKSVSRQIRDEMTGYFNKVESWIRREGVDIENLRKSFDKNFK